MSTQSSIKLLNLERENRHMRWTSIIGLLMAAWLCGASESKAAPPGDKAHKPLFAPESHFQVLLHSLESVDSMAMSCDTTSDDPGNLDEFRCEFRQIIVTKKAPDPDRLKRYEEELRKQMGGPGAWKKQLSHCAESKKFLTSVQSLFTNKYKTISLEREKSMVDTLCACQTAECVINILLEDSKKSQTKCSIMGTQFEATFKRKAATRWVSVNGPQGTCSVVLTMIIEYDAAEDSWSYTQKRLLTEPPQEPLCPQSLESNTRAFSHYKYLRDAVMDCETIGTIIP